VLCDIVEVIVALTGRSKKKEQNWRILTAAAKATMYFQLIKECIYGGTII
jgi:hypothetical protein